jgi:hypothetical protein
LAFQRQGCCRKTFCAQSTVHTADLAQTRCVGCPQSALKPVSGSCQEPFIYQLKSIHCTKASPASSYGRTNTLCCERQYVTSLHMQSCNMTPCVLHMHADAVGKHVCHVHQQSSCS